MGGVCHSLHHNNNIFSPLYSLYDAMTHLAHEQAVIFISIINSIIECAVCHVTGGTCLLVHSSTEMPKKVALDEYNNELLCKFSCHVQKFMNNHIYI